VRENFWLGTAIILASGAINGSFAVPMKYARRWRWENTWLVFSLISLLVLPWILALSFVPHLVHLYQEVPSRAILYPVAFGFLWGIAQTTFGLGISMVGMGLAFAIVSGLACLSGPLVPLLAFNPAGLFQPKGILLLLSIPILLVGLVLYGKAGRKREHERKEAGSAKGQPSRTFAIGLGICIFTGIVSSAWNLGFAFSGSILQRSSELGARALTAPYSAWALILTAGLIPNLLYCFFVLFRDRTWSFFGRAGSARDAMLSLAMAVLWLSGIEGYGIGATLVGKYGTSIGFTLFIAGQILASSMLGVLTGEWKGTSSGTRRELAMAVVVTLVSVVVLNLGGVF
jgi:L-rhamnose-H+ transport protein